MTTPPPTPAFIPAPLVPRDSQPACDGRWDLFDVLIGGRPSAGRPVADWRMNVIREAADMCDRCPVRKQCHTKALEVNEGWVRLIIAALRTKRGAAGGSTA